MKNDLGDKSTGFIVSEKLCRCFDNDLELYYCEFNLSAYKNKYFNLLNIEFPNSMVRSVCKRRAEFLAGRYCARQSLKRLGIYDYQISIGKHREPIWPDTVVGAISHSSRLAICVTTQCESAIGVGVDVEKFLDCETAKKIQNQFASEPEISLIDSIEFSKSKLLTILFSVKESFFKAAYPSVNRYFGFDAVSLIEIDLANQSLMLGLNQHLATRLQKGMVVPADFRFLNENEIVTQVVLNL